MWTISEIWNKSVEQRETREIKPREKMWASELGKADIDIYLKLMGEKPSNDFDDRSIRKFEAGNLFEWIVKIILIRCGIYQESQKWLGYKMDGCLEVSGKLDHLAGGVVNYEQAKKELLNLQLPDFFNRATEQILDYFKEKYPEGLPQQGIEVKSTSSYGIEKVYFTGKALAGHDLQTFHYAYATKLPFIILYICRDDLRMADIPILPDDKEFQYIEDNLSKMLLSYSEWNHHEKYVIKGEKSLLTNKFGTKLFTKEQTNQKNYYDNSSYEFEYDGFIDPTGQIGW
jgi:hypothetical protein